MVSPVVTGAAPDGTPIAEPEWCAPALARLSDAAASLGYRISGGTPGIAGSRGSSHLQATCSADDVAIEIAEETGPLVTVALSRGPGFALEIVGQYPGVGSVSQTALIESAAEATSIGSLTFAADTDDAWAFVEFDLAGEVMADGGDAAVVNDQLAPVLAASRIWRDAHALTLALADIRGLDLLLTVAVPNPRASGIKKSMVGQAMACGKAAVMCTLAATWLPPAVTTCYGDSVACALAIGCALVSCID